jgi:3-oxoacyl-[acyl-carrier-protein] synthase III
MAGGSGPINRGVTITGWGASLPDTVVTNEDLTTLFETTDEWIVERSGIRARHVATGPFVPGPDRQAGEDGVGTTATLAIEAGRKALARAGVEPGKVGLLILCTTSPDQAVPATSAAVAAALGIGGGAMDLNGACAGFTYGMVAAHGMVTGGLDRVLLIGAETLSRLTNWTDRTNAFLFGDGAGAVLFEAEGGDDGLLGWDLGVDGSQVSILYADHVGSGMVMKGREVFRRAIRATVESAALSLERAKVDPAEVALFVPHQANWRIMTQVAERLGIPEDRVASVIETTGNTSSASIPLALVDALDAGRVHEGDVILLAGFGAGMTWASAVWRWLG